ncbi:hypothetical protein D3C79_848050 [compost metagenome]
MELVDDKWFVTVMLEQPDLSGAHIGDTEVAHFSRRLELMLRFGYFFGVHQRIGTVQQQDINIVCAEAG